MEEDEKIMFYFKMLKWEEEDDDGDDVQDLMCIQGEEDEK